MQSILVLTVAGIRASNSVMTDSDSDIQLTSSGEPLGLVLVLR